MKTNSSKRQLVTILLIVFLGFMGISMPYLIFPALFLNPAYSILPPTWSLSTQSILLGVTLAAYPLGQFIGSPVLGALSDDYGRKRLLAGSLVIAAICNLMTGLALDFRLLWIVILTRFAAGIMEGNVAIARAMAADLKSIPKHETFGKVNAVTSMAYLLGPLIGGLLADNQFIKGVTISTPFYLIGFLFLGLALLTTWIIQEQPSSKVVASTDVWSRFRLIYKMSKLFKNKQLRFFMVVSTIFTLAVDIFYEFSPVYLTAKWMLSPIQLISYNSVLCVALVIGNGWLASFVSQRYSPHRFILGAVGGLSLLLLSIVLVDQPIMMVGLFALCGIFIGLGVTLLTVKISDAAPDTIQGEVMGVQLSLRVLGDAIICLLGGLLLIISPKLILIVAALLSAIIMIYYALQEKRFKQNL